MSQRNFVERRKQPGIPGPPGPPGPAGPAGPTGARGLAGSAGAKGARGLTGKRGPRGATGSTGKTGSPGATGKAGARGPQGREPAWRRQLLLEVQEQIDRVDHELDIQLKRMAQIQQDLDQLRAKVRQLAEGGPAAPKR